MSRQIAAPAVLACLLALSACAEPREPGGPGSDQPAVTLAGTEWQLSEIGGAPVAAEAWIAFEPGGSAGGNAGCNRFGGDYDRDGTGLVFTDIAATLMGCADPGQTSTEAGFLAALQATRRGVVSNSVLELRDGEGDLLATLTRRG